MGSSLRLVKSSKETRSLSSELELSVREWLLELRQAQRSPQTIEKYQSCLVRFVDWLAVQGCCDFECLDRLLLREWGAALQEESGWSPATVRLCMAAVRSFLKWCAAEGYLEESLSGLLKLPVVKARVQRTVFEGDVAALLAACDDSVCGRRDAAIVSLMIDTGLRASEVCRLRLADVRLSVLFEGVEINYLSVLVKGGREDVAFFGSSAALDLRRWLEVREAMPGVETLFISLGGNKPLSPLTRSGLGGILRRLSRAAGIEHVTPHSLRRGMAIIAEGLGYSTREAQVLGRWSDITMVERYQQARRVAQIGVRYANHSPANAARNNNT